MNYIGLDISKISSAVSIETKYNQYLFSYNTHKPTYKWNKLIKDEEGVFIRNYEYSNEIKNYSKSEINKLIIFIKISNDIIKDILSVIDKNDNTLIYAEGYSYSKNPGPIIDLVGISSLIRSKLYENIPNIKEMKIIAPKSLKLISCEMVYGFKMIEKGKRKIKIIKEINTNNKNIKGGDFTKHDMFQAIIDHKKPYNLNKIFDEKYNEIISVKTFPKPLEDLNDAYLLKEIIKYNEKIQKNI